MSLYKSENIKFSILYLTGQVLILLFTKFNLSQCVKFWTNVM
jgi:hypothetical protein